MAMGDPALVGGAGAATVELAPEASTRDGAFTVRSILLSTKVLVLAALVAKASKGMATDLLVVTNVGAAEGCDAEALVGSTAETLGATAVADVTIALGLAVGAPVSVVAGFDG